jgi:membrane dipeptidase
MSAFAPKPTVLPLPGVDPETIALLQETEAIDLHIDTLIPPRLWGYHPLHRHDRHFLRGHFFGHLDLPRMQDSGLSGAMWSITTNPFRPAGQRLAVFARNLKRFHSVVAESQGALGQVRTATQWQEVRQRGAHGVLLSIQGGNALQAAPNPAQILRDAGIVRVTLVHLTDSDFGGSSVPVPMRRSKALTPRGQAFIEVLNQERIFLDLAHIHPLAFAQAVSAHDRTQPLIATHTGVDGIRPHWRNLADDQLRAIASTGGVVGVIAAQNFLQRRGGPTDAHALCEHWEHIIRVAGEDTPALGTDLDGAIIPPRDLRDGYGLPRLVQAMRDRHWTTTRIQKVLAGNFLRAFAELRP